jgi:ATP-binding cassette subfamily B protein
MLTGKYVNKYYFKYAGFFIIGLLALLAVNYFQLEIPEICGDIIDGIQDGTLIDNKGLVVELMYRLGFIAFVLFVGRFGWRYFIIGAAERIEADMREEMFSHAEKLSNQYYKEHKTGALLALFTNDLLVVKHMFGFGFIMLVDAVFLGGLSIVKMFAKNWIMTLFALIPMSFIAISAIYVGRVMEKKFKERQEAYEDLSDFTQENFSGISVIKAFVKQVVEVLHFEKINKKNYDKNMNYIRFSMLLHVMLGLIIALIMVVLIGGGAYFSIYGFNGQGFSSGDVWEFVLLFNSTIWPFMAVSELINSLAQANASLDRINEFLDTKVEIVDEDVLDVNEIKGKIEFRNLNFKYPDGNEVILDDISFTINSGEMVGIIGKTGCGKTTIVDLLLRTYNVDENSILIDDIDIMKIPFKKVRESIGYVPQDNFLFSDTISNNIAFAFEDIEEEKIVNAAMLADVHNNIVEFTEQYNTVLGERGVTLSGGQKQRVSIARALIKDPAILIFDDSVSAVDTKTEETILTNLRRLRTGKTTIMIAHRISTVETLDKIILVDDGRVLAVGTHNELLEKSEVYKEMVYLQSLEKEVNGGEA